MKSITNDQALRVCLSRNDPNDFGNMVPYMRPHVASRLLLQYYTGIEFFHWCNWTDWFREGIEEYALPQQWFPMKYYRAKPDIMTIYRGTTTEEANSGECGLAWTDSFEMAEWFANRWVCADSSNLKFGDGKPIVVSAKILKACAAGYVMDRNEQEIVVTNNDYLTDVRIVNAPPKAEQVAA